MVKIGSGFGWISAHTVLAKYCNKFFQFLHLAYMKLIIFFFSFYFAKKREGRIGFTLF